MVELTDAQIDAAAERGRIAHETEPRAASVRYDRQLGRVIVDLTNGCTFAFPPRLAQGLESATDDWLAEIEILGWLWLALGNVDADLSIPGLLAGIFGTRAYMARRAGQATSPAKAAAARANGCSCPRLPASISERLTFDDRAAHPLSADRAPMKTGHVDVGEGHSIYYERSGRRAASRLCSCMAVPAAAFRLIIAQRPDLELYDVTLFDQRGCGRSTPHAGLDANTTWHLVADIERLRVVALAVDKWSVFGGLGDRRWRSPMRRRIPPMSANSCCAESIR